MNMWYKIKVLFCNDKNIFDNYLCYSPDKGFYLGTRSNARFFRKEHLDYDEKLKIYLKDKAYKLEQCNGKHNFLVYRGKTF